MINETQAFGNSAMHRMDERLRLVVWGAASLALALCTRPAAMCLGLAFGLFLLALSRPGFSWAAKRLALVNTMAAFFWVFLPFTQAGEATWSIGPLTATREGLDLALGLTLKMNAIGLFTLALVATMPVASMGRALGNLGAPQKLTVLLLFTYRYLFVLERERRQMAVAAKLRGFSPGTDLHTYRTYAYMAGMLLVRAMERGKRVHQAMLCRGFDGAFKTLDIPSLSGRDVAWSMVFFLFLAMVGVLQWNPRLPF